MCCSLLQASRLQALGRQNLFQKIFLGEAESAKLHWLLRSEMEKALAAIEQRDSQGPRICLCALCKAPFRFHSFELAKIGKTKEHFKKTLKELLRLSPQANDQAVFRPKTACSKCTSKVFRMLQIQLQRARPHLAVRMVAPVAIILPNKKQLLIRKLAVLIRKLFICLPNGRPAEANRYR